MCHQDLESFIRHTSKFLCLSPELCVCDSGMAGSIEINSNGGSKQGHLETKNIISPLLNAYGHQTWQVGDLP